MSSRKKFTTEKDTSYYGKVLQEAFLNTEPVCFFLKYLGKKIFGLI